MTSFNEAKKSALEVLTSNTGPIPQLEREWLFTFTDPYIGPLPDMYREFYRLKGFTKTSLNDRARDYLIDQGYTGDVHTMWYEYWLDGGEAVV